MSTIRQFYANKVDTQWPDVVPPLNAHEAKRAAKALYRFVFKRPWSGEILVTSGNRNNYIRYIRDERRQMMRKVIAVNPGRGWKNMVHELSHSFFTRLHPNKKAHDRPHGGLEREMIRYVVDHGWLDGKLAAKPKVEPDVRIKRKQQTLDGIARWETKLKRATNALKKLRRRLAYYERTAA